MDPMEAALADLRVSEHPNISAAAREYNVGRSALSRRFNEKTLSKEHWSTMNRLLSKQQEEELIRWISRQCDRCLPPTPSMVAIIASDMAGSVVSKSWPSRFVSRYRDQLDSRYLDVLDLARHKSESRASFERYFEVIRQKIEEYEITAENTYNMDEKGFMIGHVQKSFRIYAKNTDMDRELIKAGQDGNREWITCIAAICADGSVLSPSLIYKAVSGNIQDTWLDGFDPTQHSCYFASSPTGWTSDMHGLAWLDRIFERETKAKAGRSWRLLFIDGHGSHLNMKFLDYCERARILLAVYPPHSTHKLQPLDVRCFRPLAHYYSKGLEELIYKTAGISAIRKRDFFNIFWEAWPQAFKEETIKSAWENAGLFPFNPAVVLDTLPKRKGDDGAVHRDVLHDLNSNFKDQFNIAAKNRQICKEMDEITSKVDADSAKRIDQVFDLLQQTNAELSTVKREVANMAEALKRERDLKTRGLTTIEQIRSEDGTGHTFFSPKKIERARDLYMAKQQEKEQKEVDKQVQKDARAQRKLEQAAEAQRRAAERAAAVARRAEEGLQKQAQRQVDRATKQAERERKLADKALKSASRVQTIKNKPPAEPIVEPTSPEVTASEIGVFSRSGRILKVPARLRD